MEFEDVQELQRKTFAGEIPPEVDTFIQWKGTDVCMDFHCKCGAHLHIDGDFVYHVKCAHCDRIYTMGHTILAFERPAGEPEPECMHVAEENAW